MASLVYGSTEIVRDGNLVTYILSGVTVGSCAVDSVDGSVGLSLNFGERTAHLSAGEVRILFDLEEVVESVAVEESAPTAKRSRRR